MEKSEFIIERKRNNITTKDKIEELEKRISNIEDKLNILIKYKYNNKKQN